MKIFIGITQNPDKIRSLFSPQSGEEASLTELGPFVSKQEALNWLVFLKGKILDIAEIQIDEEPLKDAGWYGFTFEQESGN